jgi:hypothetical protein
VAPYSLIQYERFNEGRKKEKLKKLAVHKFQNARQARTGRNVVKNSSPNAASAWLIFLSPRTHAKTSQSLTFKQKIEKKYTVNVQYNVQCTQLLLNLMLVVSYSV